MDFPTAQPIVDALTARAQEGIWGYTSRPDSYFEAIRGWQKRRNGWDIDPSLVSFSLGVVQSISAMVKLFTPEGGSVLIQTPVYSEFYDMTEAWNRKVLENPFVEKDGRWEMDWADFEAKLAEADLFLLCSPHNPLGIVWTPEELRRMVELCIKHRVGLFSDEIHSDLIFHGKRHTPTASVSDEAARYVVTGISGTKTFNLAGLQASTVVFPNAHMKQVFDQFWMNMAIPTTPSPSPPWRPPSTTARSGWSSCCPTCPPTSTLWRTTAGSTFHRSRPAPPTPPTSCGWTAGRWAWTTTPCAAS